MNDRYFLLDLSLDPQPAQYSIFSKLLQFFWFFSESSKYRISSTVDWPPQSTMLDSTGRSLFSCLIIYLLLSLYLRLARMFSTVGLKQDICYRINLILLQYSVRITLALYYGALIINTGNRTMMQQQQKPPTPPAWSQLPQQQLGNLQHKIKQTYQGKSTPQVKQAEQQIMELLSSNRKIVVHLFQYLRTPFHMDCFVVSFRRASANFIKKYYYVLAQDDSPKDQYVQLVYDVLLAVGYGQYGVKEILAVALEYIFNKDELMQYKNKWAQHIKAQLCGLSEHPEAWTLQTLQVIHGLILFCISLFNSYVQPEQQIAFANQLLQPMCKAGSFCAEFTRQNINQSIDTRVLFLPPLKIFEFFQLCTERLMEEEELIEEEVHQFKTSEHLHNLILEYLYMFSQGPSIISNYNNLNQIKASIMQILYTFTAYDCDIGKSVLTVLFSTFVSESSMMYRNEENSDFNDRILCKTIAILEKMLDKKINYDFFLNNKVELAFSLLMYCKTSSQQVSDMYEQPQKFVMLAQQFSQSFASSPIIKIRASNLLKTFVNRIDEALSNITQLCVIFITGSLKSSESDSQILRMAKQAYSTFEFMDLSKQQKLDISFMVLTVLSQKLQKRPDTRAVITSILMTNFNSLFQITNDLVLNRIIRLVGYYPNAIYFNFVNKLMMMSKANMLEGLNCYDRICRNKLYLEIFPLMHMVFLGIIEYLEVGEPIFERLIHENYENIMKKSQQLYMQVLNKIYKNFHDVITNLAVKRSQQRAIICLNYIQKMMKAQKCERYFQLLEAVYIKMLQIGINVEILEDNFIGIQCMLIGKMMVVSERVQEFVRLYSRPQKVSNYSNTTQYFQLLNKYIIKSENQQILSQICTNLTQYLSLSQNNQFNYAILPQIAHSIGHIALNNHSIEPSQYFLLFIIRLASKKQQVRTYLSLYQSWYTFLILHYLYRNAGTMRDFLIRHQVYQSFIMVLLQTKWNTKIQRKVAVIALQELLSHEQNQKIRLEIIKYCVYRLKEQKERYELRNKVARKQRFRHREQMEKSENGDQYQMDESQNFDRESGQECRQNYEKDKDEDGVLKKFKHPFDKICEFSMFKQRIHGLFHEMKSINEENVPGIKEILQRQWHQSSVRRILKVSK